MRAAAATIMASGAGFSVATGSASVHSTDRTTRIIRPIAASEVAAMANFRGRGMLRLLVVVMAPTLAARALARALKI